MNTDEVNRTLTAKEEALLATRRPRSQYMEDHIGAATPVLDHGFIRLIDYMGTSDSIVQAARVSYGSGTKSIREDRGLIRYLMRHHHTTPFEMCELKLHVKLPIFVARQWVRHRTASINEYSARYSILKDEFYSPQLEQMCSQSKKNAQGRAEPLSENLITGIDMQLGEHEDSAYALYCYLTSDDVDLTRELARMVLPLNIYTEWYWKVNLHNLLHFLELRTDPHAQWEIRQYANEILNTVENWVPHVHEAFMDYRVNAVTFSAAEFGLVKYLVDDPSEGVFKEEWVPDKMSSREWEAFWARFDKEHVL